jgi:hypothetical protein
MNRSWETTGKEIRIRHNDGILLAANTATDIDEMLSYNFINKEECLQGKLLLLKNRLNEKKAS